ncbi:HigA family addiction module antidote protein [Paracoccus caeni]|uniref:HigA family addiction module antidote protein n=1 Tax=Paracoccus caeni TaxID=657651 RepID=A0A934W2T5_9RHOB|nr:HigA family addiction module antitoxin [Paracoccus caeni]MBK4218099.1 HigA family addiction module antidote protein [Paracoccus caeni]
MITPSYHRPAHPGEILREDVFPHLDLTLAEFAQNVGVEIAELAGILNETCPITEEAATGIGALCGNGADIWLRLQAVHDDWRPVHSFEHAVMHTLADWPVLSRIAARYTKAKRLDSRAVGALYARSTGKEWQAMEERERTYAATALKSG